MMFSNTAQYSRTTLRSDIRLATKPAVFVAHVWGERTEGEIARQGLPNDLDLWRKHITIKRDPYKSVGRIKFYY